MHEAPNGFDAETAAELVRQRDTSDMLLSVASALAEPTDIPAVSQIIADAVPTVCQSDRGAVILWDEATGCFVVSAIAGWTGESARRMRLWAGTPFESQELQQFMHDGRPMLLAGASNAWPADVDEFEITALALAPVAVAGRFMGFVVAHWADTDAPAELDDTLRGRLTGLAALAGVALDNNRLATEITWNLQHDSVTGLPNRVALEASLSTMIERADASGRGVVVIVCDIDRFKRLNDRLGAAAGDVVLRVIGERLQDVVRIGDFVARYGSDEFAIAFAKTANYDEIVPAVARIQRAFKHPISVEGHDIVLSVSIGFSTLTDIGREGSPTVRAQRLAANAESDLVGKKTARRAVRGASVTDDELDLDTDLHGAVARGEIITNYQPQTDITTGRIVAVEALARWMHPTRGLVRPDHFISLAEENGTISEIGEQVLITACRDAQSWMAAGHDVEVSVNASVVQLERVGYAASVAAVLSALDFPPHMLTIEVTESKVVSDMSVAQAELRALGRLGVGISIDDFGTGFSSLTQISNLPVTELKIDRSFVDRLTAGGEKLVAAVIGLSRGLELRVVAEGVETPEQLEALARLGCDRAQGFLISRPVLADELLGLLDSTTTTA